MLASAIALIPTLIGHPGQQDQRGEIAVPRASSLAISPTGDLWLVSKDGRLFVSRDRNQYWSEVETPARKPGGLGLGEDKLEHIAFFDPERALIAGYIGDEDRKQVLRTEDGGKTWSLVTLPLKLWVYDMQVMPDGRAWLVGSNGKLLASEDFGATWRIAGTPFDTLRRSQSVWFASPDIGVVGANLNAIQLTNDGGRTWQAVTTPADALLPLEADEHGGGGSMLVEEEDGTLGSRDLPPGHRDPVSDVWILGGNLFALQRRQMFERSLGPDGAWTPVEFEGHKVVAGEAVAGGLIAVTEDKRVVQVSEALPLRLLTPDPLEQVPLAIAQDDRACAFLMARGRVCLLEEGRITCSNLHSQGPERSWPISSFDRAGDGALFGTSSTALYRSIDSGRTWERLAEKDGISGVAAFKDGSGVVVTTKEGLASWTKERPELAPVLAPGEDEKRLSIQARKGPLWIATSFDTDGNPKAERMMRTSDTVLRGAHFTALVYASADEGRSWKRIESYAGAIVHALWLGSDGVLSLCMSDNEIRAAKLDVATGAPDAGGFRTLSSGGEGLGGQWASWLAFPLPDEGWVGGNLYFRGPVLHRTQDGGRTWQATESTEVKVIEAYRLGDGACVRIGGFWRKHSSVDVWRDGAFHEVRTFEAGVHDASVDATGCLLVRLENAEVWTFSADAREWAEIGPIPLPPH